MNTTVITPILTKLQKDAARFAFMDANEVVCRKRENGYWEASSDAEHIPWVSRKTLAACIDVLIDHCRSNQTRK